MAERSYKSNLIQQRKTVFMRKMHEGCFFTGKRLSKNLCGVFAGKKKRIALLFEKIYG